MTFGRLASAACRRTLSGANAATSWPPRNARNAKKMTRGRGEWAFVAGDRFIG